MSLDHDPDIFFSFLMDLQKGDQPRLTKRTVKLLMKFTVNLDQSLRQNIAYLRSVSDVESCMDAIEPTTEPTPESPLKEKLVKKEDSVEILHPYMYGPGWYGAGLYNTAFDPRIPYPSGNHISGLQPAHSFTTQPSVAPQPSMISPEKSPTAVEKPKDTVDKSSEVEED